MDGAVSRRKGPGPAADRRLAATVAVLAALAALFPALGPSCASGRGRGPDAWVPRDLRGAPVVRVALARASREGRAKVEVRGPYEIYSSPRGTPSPDDPRARPAFAGEALAAADLVVEGGGSGLSLGGTSFRPGPLRVAPKKPGTLVVDGVAYRGDLVADALPGGRLVVLNRVNLEEYTAGVLGCEMPVAYPDAALRAQAVASRTYGLHAVRSRAREPWDVMDDQSSQVYQGLLKEDDRTRRATIDTLGVVLTYGERVLKTYFHSTCGGETTSAAWVFGDAEVPPLAGGPCGFCESSKYYRWRHEVAREELRERLAKEGPPLAVAGAQVTRVEVRERGPGGYAGRVDVVHPGGLLAVQATKLRWVLGTSAVRSTRFEIEEAAGGRIAFVGRGWGHGVGMCQVGAGGMARAGHDTAAILRRYYPAAELRRIYAAEPGPGTAQRGDGGNG